MITKENSASKEMKDFVFMIMLLCILVLPAGIAIAQQHNYTITPCNTNGYCLNYFVNGASKQVFLPIPADSLIVVHRIWVAGAAKKSGTFVNDIETDSLLVISLSDFNFSNQSYLFAVHKQSNILEDFGGKIPYLRTGLPFYIFTADSMIIASNTCTFMGGETERTIVHYDKLHGNHISWRKDKKVVVRMKDMDEGRFLLSSTLKQLLK